MKPSNAIGGVVRPGNGQRTGSVVYVCLWLSISSLLAGANASAQEDGKPKPEVLIAVSISPEARVKASPVSAARVLRQGEWTEFLVTIENTAGITSPLVIESEQLMRDESSGSLRKPTESRGSLREPTLDRGAVHDHDRSRWMHLDWDAEKPLTGALNETRRVRIWSRDQGVRSVVLNFNAGQGTQDLGFRSDVLLSFRVQAK